MTNITPLYTEQEILAWNPHWFPVKN